MPGGTFSQLVREQLAGLPGVEFRRMFGGQGIYRGKDFFGIVFHGRLYFKTDDSTRPDYEAAGMEPFRPNAKPLLPAYREVPAAVLENAVLLCEWAGRAAQSALVAAEVRRRNART